MFPTLGPFTITPPTTNLSPFSSSSNSIGPLTHYQIQSTQHGWSFLRPNTITAPTTLCLCVMLKISINDNHPSSRVCP
ncbi:hypothetical protein RJT34_24404 [Clitoria ternatea]|uniref:Uncharacterized protein n=1 Tax=Clitoria ternatea TaxID=43366 RepID=A0AAN9IJ72_CLITE